MNRLHYVRSILTTVQDSVEPKTQSLAQNHLSECAESFCFAPPVSFLNTKPRDTQAGSGVHLNDCSVLWHMSRLTPFGFLFGKNLTNLVRGIRRHEDPEQLAEYLRGVISECRDEVRSPDLDVKTTAILKLAYLEMKGFDMAWAGFHVTEVMASPNFQQKRIGYLAAMQSFRSDSELLMLVTNLVKMDLINQNPSTVGIALSGLATIVTPLLAADVSDDIMRMLSHSNPYIRKKAVLALHNIIIQYPEALPIALQRFSDLLVVAQQDPEDAGNVSVIGATVSVISELAHHAPSVQDFLELTPKLYAIFTTSQHNWTIIKLLKIFQLFTRREPRLKSRLLPPVRELMGSREAVSLVHESMHCIILGNMLESGDFTLASEIRKHATSMMEKNDPNLTYLATKTLDMLADINPQFIEGSNVIELLRTPQSDPITRVTMLNLASKVVNDDSFFDLVSELMNLFREANSQEYKEKIAVAISKMAAVRNYEFVPDFQWLIEKVFTELCQKTKRVELSQRLLDIVIRVKDDSVRQSISTLCYNLLDQRHSTEESVSDTATSKASQGEFFETCWWIVGEFPTAAMLGSPHEFYNRVSSFSGKSILAAMVTSVVKLVSKTADPSNETLDAAIEFLTPYSMSLEYELQERSCQFLELLKLARSSQEQGAALVHNGLSSLFESYELTPVAPGSQRRIKPPVDLDLDTPVEVPALAPDHFDESSSESDSEPVHTQGSTNTSQHQAESTPLSEKEEAEKQLYNLSSLESMRASYKKPIVERPTKKKVIVALDETVDGPDSDLPIDNTSSIKPASLFRSGFRGSTNQLIEPDMADPPPVKVKHKKKKKQKKPEDSKASEENTHSH